jgi:hypothetical protein
MCGQRLGADKVLYFVDPRPMRLFMMLACGNKTVGDL